MSTTTSPRKSPPSTPSRRGAASNIADNTSMDVDDNPRSTTSSPRKSPVSSPSRPSANNRAADDANIAVDWEGPRPNKRKRADSNPAPTTPIKLSNSRVREKEKERAKAKRQAEKEKAKPPQERKQSTKKQTSTAKERAKEISKAKKQTKRGKEKERERKKKRRRNRSETSSSSASDVDDGESSDDEEFVTTAKERDSPALKKFKSWVYIHIRLLWGLFNQDSIPPPVTAAAVKEWDAKKTTPDNIEATLIAIASTNKAASQQCIDKAAGVKDRAAHGNSIIEKVIAKMDEGALAHMYHTVGRLGLKVFAPQCTSNSPESPYNLVHELVALSTFRTMAGIGIYPLAEVKMQPWFHDEPYIREIYRHFVYKLMGTKVKAESRSEGAHEKSRLSAEARTQRDKVMNHRLSMCLEYGYATRYHNLISVAEVHSDDELAGDKSHWRVRAKVGRSENMTEFVQYLDLRYQKWKARRGVIAKEKERKRDYGEPLPPLLEEAPEGVPRDYHSSSAWNNDLTALEQYELRDYGVAFPHRSLADELKQKYQTDCSGLFAKQVLTMPDKEFNAQFAAKVLETYPDPTPAEIRNLRKSGLIEGKEAESDDGIELDSDDDDAASFIYDSDDELDVEQGGNCDDDEFPGEDEHVEGQQAQGPEADSMEIEEEDSPSNEDDLPAGEENLAQEKPGAVEGGDGAQGDDI